MPPARSILARLAEGGTLDRIATVDEVARVVEFFAGPMGAFVSGQVVRVDGGRPAHKNLGGLTASAMERIGLFAGFQA